MGGANTESREAGLLREGWWGETHREAGWGAKKWPSRAPPGAGWEEKGSVGRKKTAQPSLGLRLGRGYILGMAEEADRHYGTAPYRW